MDHPHRQDRAVSRRAVALKWGARLAIGLFAIGFGAFYMYGISPEPWWRTAGLASDPGDFIRKLAVSYPVCRPWQARAGRAGLASDRQDKALHVVQGGTAEPVVKGDPESIGFRIPKSAQVLRVYCGVSAGARPAQECSQDACGMPIRAIVTDDLYTRGRTLVFTLKNRARSAAPPPDVTLWLVWK